MEEIRDERRISDEAQAIAIIANSFGAKMQELGEALVIVAEQMGKAFMVIKEEVATEWEKFQEHMAIMEEINELIEEEDRLRDTWVIVKRYKNLHKMRMGDWTWQLRPRFRI